MSERPSNPDRGKCKSCGYLAKRSSGGSFGSPPAIDYEATPDERRSTPHFFKRWNEYGAHRSMDFSCFRGVADLSQEYRHEANETLKTTAAMVMLDQDRKCEQWYPYMPGFSPQQHYEWFQEEERERRWEKFEQWMEIGRRDFDEKLTKRQEDFEIAIALRNESLQTQRDLQATKSDRVMKGLTLAALIFAAAQVLTMTKDSLLARAVMFVWHSLFG